MTARETPDEYRRRYFELKCTAQEQRERHRALRPPENSAVLPGDLMVTEESIPGGWYWTTRVARGRSLRIVNDEATAGVSAVFWNADDVSERYNAGDTVKVQWIANLTVGRLLLSDMGRVLASISADSSTGHDSIMGGSTRASDTRRYGAPAPRNTRENLVLAAGKFGMSARDVPPCITFFAPVSTSTQGAFFWRETGVRAGDYIDLRAEMNLLVALSNCPHPLSPESVWAPRPVRAVVWRSPPAAREDYCRTATAEAVRAFENTDRYHAEFAP